MEVWTLTFGNDMNDKSLIGVYSSREKAIEGMIRFNKKIDGRILEEENKGEYYYNTVYWCIGGRYEIEWHVMDDTLENNEGE